MEELLKELLLLLNGAGIRTRAAFPYATAPKLREPVTTVRIERARASECAMGRYLGEYDDPETGRGAVSGRALELTAALRVASPVGLGGERCFQEANRLMAALLDAGSFGEVTQEACRYDRETNLFVCDVRAELRARLAAEPEEEQMLTDVTVRKK